jgi:Fe-S-cluster containining protein
MDIKKEIDKILKTARNSISDYCINTCNAKCCRKGELFLINKKEIEFICGNEIDLCLKNKILYKSEYGNYRYRLEKKSCPHLSYDFKCNAWKDKERPQICKDFPLIFNNGIVFASNFCPAVIENKFEKYFKKIEEIGIKIIK